ncbi:hypothetical protein D9M71_543860 [compost metagenome]
MATGATIGKRLNIAFIDLEVGKKTDGVNTGFVQTYQAWSLRGDQAQFATGQAGDDQGWQLAAANLYIGQRQSLVTASLGLPAFRVIAAWASLEGNTTHQFTTGQQWQPTGFLLGTTGLGNGQAAKLVGDEGQRRGAGTNHFIDQHCVEQRKTDAAVVFWN